jgi:hypothetical protein
MEALEGQGSRSEVEPRYPKKGWNNMSTVTRPEVREGYFPRWRLKTTGVIMPEERLPWGQTIVSGLQHGVAMSGGTIIAPLIMGFDPALFGPRNSDLLCRCRRTRTKLFGLELLVHCRRHCGKRLLRPWAKPEPRPLSQAGREMAALGA